MARVKTKRHGVVTDMTAMCDVAFLLLTFFILTTQFKKPDVEQIKPPSSISEKILPDASLMTVNVTSAGKFYFQPVENASERLELINGMATKYNVSLSDADKAVFVNKVQSVGVPMNQLKSFLELSDDQRKAFVEAPGVPMDSINRQLIDWIDLSRKINPDYKLAVKGDIKTEYPKVKALFEGLRDIKMNNFWLITSQETATQ